MILVVHVTCKVNTDETAPLNQLTAIAAPAVSAIPLSSRVAMIRRAAIPIMDGLTA